MASLKVKQAELQEITDKLNKLIENLDTKQTEKKVRESVFLKGPSPSFSLLITYKIKL